MTERFKLPRSLNAKMLYVILLSLAAALAVYLAVTWIGDLAVEKIYMSPEAVSARKAEIYSRFSAYVTEEGISGEDSAAVAAWTRRNEYTTILLYQGDSLNLLAEDGQAQSSDSMQNYERLQYASQYGKLYPLRFSNGVYHIAIGDNTELRELRLNRLIAVALAGTVFVAGMLWYISRLSSRIIRLARQALEIGAGDLEGPITVKGEDELAQLAGSVDNMRRSVIERMLGERRAWEANSELITAISHDIRTPMTSLIGYLGLLNDGSFTDPERIKQFTSSAYGKAMELKDLTDELFKYFLVFGPSQLELDMDAYDGQLLLGELLGELEFDLRDAGFEIERISRGGACTVNADPLYLKRILNNLESNVKKYADPARPVVLLDELREERFCVCVSNSVGKNMDRVESSKIGLRTCEKMMDLMGGSFTVTKDEEHFAAELSLPAVPGAPEEGA